MFMVAAGQLSAQHTARETWRKSWVTHQLLDLAVVDLKRKKIEELLNAGFPSEVKPEREGELERKLSYLSCSNLAMTSGQGRFFPGKMTWSSGDSPYAVKMPYRKP